MTNKYPKLILSIAIILFSTSLFLLVAFNSHWDYGIIDQSEIGSSRHFENAQNSLGGLGALLSNFFISSFGISAYLFVSLTFLYSIKLIFNIQYFDYLNTLNQHIFFILWSPLFISKLSPTLTGKIGIIISKKLVIFIGNIGLSLFLITTLILFLILRFNINQSKIYRLLQFFNFKKVNQNNVNINNQDYAKNEETESLTQNQKSEEDDTINQDIENKEKELIIKIAEQEKTVEKNQIDSTKHDIKDELEDYKFPDLNLMNEYSNNQIAINKEELEENKKRIQETLETFGIEVRIERATVGPTITLYEIIPKEGVRIAKIKSLENDIALRIKAVGVRIIAPLPGKGTVGIEVPNESPTIVSMKNVLKSEKFQKSDYELPIALGKTISNETFVMDLVKMPHLLMAGATGQGKSVGLNAILCSILYKKHPSQVKLILVDPKKVELTLYNKIEKHFLAKLPGDGESIITDNKNVVKTLNSLCIEMDNRYNLLKKAEVRNIQEYNKKYKSKQLKDIQEHRFLPYLILVIDEFADLIMTAGKEIEIPIARLAQLSRAIGIHLIIATQRPTTNIITGTIKANFPTRIAFRVTQGIDSKTILDSVGANQLIGRGDMLISTGSSLSRIQCAFIDTPELEKLTAFIGTQKGYEHAFLLPKSEGDEKEIIIDGDNYDRDPLFKEAAILLVMHQQGSTSMIQRKLKLGYNRAGRIVDQLEDAGILGPLEGSKGRKVLVQTEDELNQIIT